MKLRVQLLGRFGLFTGPDAKPIPVRSYSKLYSFLALNMNSAVTRREIMSAVWPGKEQSVVANRLRVALSELRKELGPVLTERDKLIGLTPDLTVVDIHEVQAILDETADEVDESSELEKLKSVLPLLGSQLLPELDDDWLEPFQQNWSSTALSTLRRADELAWDKNEPALAIQVAEAGLNHDPYEDYFWRSLLRAKAAIGDASEALRVFSSARKRLKDDFDSDFSPETVDVARDLRYQPVPRQGSPLGVDSRRKEEYFVGVLQQLIEHDPETAAMALGSRTLYIAHTNFADIAIEVLRSVISRVEKGSPGWAGAMLNLLLVYGADNEADQVFRLSDEMIAADVDPLTLAVVKSVRSFGHFQRREYDLALSAIEHTEQIYLERGMKRDAKWSLTNKGSYLWHLGNYEEALRLYDISLTTEGNENDVRAEVNLSIVQTNIGYVLVYQQKESEALVWHRKSVEIAVRRHLDRNFPMVLPVFGYGLFHQQRSQEGLDTLIRGLKTAYRRNHIRGQQIGLDFAAATLILGGKLEEGWTIFQYGERWRDQTRHQRSVAEHSFYIRYTEGLPESSRRVQIPIDSPNRDALNYCIKALRSVPVTEAD